MLRLLLLICSCLVPGALAKRVTGHSQLSGDVPEAFVGKFSFSVGEGLLSGKVVTHAEYPGGSENLFLYLFNDEEWPQAQASLTCVEKEKHARFRVPVPIKHEHHGDDHGEFSRKMLKASRTHYWYALLMDCSLEQVYHEVPIIEYDVVFLNGLSLEESPYAHLPADEQGLLTTHFLLMLALLAFCCFFVYKVSLQLASGKVHLVVLLLGGAAILQLGSVWSEWLHLRQYVVDGQGLRWRHTIFAFDFLSEVLQGASELIISFVLIALACGWTLMTMSAFDAQGTDNVLFQVKNAISKPHMLFKALNPGSIFVGTTALLQIFLELIGRKYEDDFNQYHDHEHWPGIMLMLMRICMAGFFGFVITKTIEQQNNGLVIDVLKQLRVFGIVWFLSFPLVVFFSSFFAAYWRHWLVSTFSLTLQSCSLCLLSLTFLTRSDYYMASSLSQANASLPAATPNEGSSSGAGSLSGLASLDASVGAKVLEGVKTIASSAKGLKKKVAVD